MNFSAITGYIRNHERYISFGSVLFGFVVDSLTLGPPDSLFNNGVFFGYLTLSGACIFLITLYERKKKQPPALLLPLMQFSFGNLAGGLFVVYGQSGTVEGSAIFLLLLVGFILANEFARDYYARLSFHLAAWYFLLFSYLAILIPILVGQVGNFIFILSGAVSLAIVALFLFALKFVSYERVVNERKLNLLLIGSILLIVNVLYFNRMIPPVPLSLTEIGIYHSLVKLPSGNYAVTYEKPPWWQFRRSTSSVFSGEGAPAYCFSAVFAPERLVSTGIYHHWEYKNPSSGKWETRTKVEFPITGGREKGYRGYSMATSPALGEWRCSVETDYGALIGRTVFTVVNRTVAMELFYTEL